MTLVKFSTRPTGRSLDHVFSGLANEWKAYPWSGQKPSPAVNVHETPEAYHLELAAPGRSKEDFAIQVEQGLLSISYEKKPEETREGYSTIRREFDLPAFRRSFQLDENILAENIQAKYEQGILKLLLPKREPAREEVKQINVQ